MAKIIQIEINRDWGIRPNNQNTIINGIVWGVKPGEQYDQVRFILEEMPNRYYCTSLGFPTGLSEEEIWQEAKEYAEKNIKQTEIEEYKKFIRDIIEGGCE